MSSIIELEKGTRRNNAYLQLIYKGIKENESVDSKDLEIAVSDMLDNLKTLDDMEQNITNLRTLLGDCEEQYLEIMTFDNKSGTEKYCYIMYEDKELKQSNIFMNSEMTKMKRLIKPVSSARKDAS